MQGQKLTILVARNAPIALILRRKPTKWYHLIKWNLTDNTLEHGAWFKGRLYEASCDISPDGHYFLYKAFQGSRFATAYTDSYTALSTVPWLKAHWLHPVGTTYEGGGYFVDNQHIKIYRVYFVELMPHPEHTDNRGFDIDHASKPNEQGYACIYHQNQHDSDNLIDNADWSKRLNDGSMIWHKDFCIYRDNQLIADFTDLTPNPTPAPY